jgi:hypothetical protein
MKNSLNFLILFLLMIVFASCEKEYTCVCEAGILRPRTTHTFKARSKAKAVDICDAFDYSSPIGVGLYDYDCSIQE